MHLVESITLWKENVAGMINYSVGKYIFSILVLDKIEILCLVPRCGRYPPEVRTGIPVDGRFEHVVLSCNATSDHAIIWIEREAENALEVSRNHIIPSNSFKRMPLNECNCSHVETERAEYGDHNEPTTSPETYKDANTQKRTQRCIGQSH